MKKSFLRVASMVMSLMMAFCCVCVPAFAMEDTMDPTIEAHPDNSLETSEMQIPKNVYPIGAESFYKMDGDVVLFADREGVNEITDETWTSIPSAYRKGSAANKGDIAYGMYVTGAGTDEAEVHFVALSLCTDADGDGVFVYNHGTKDGATVSEDVDSASNADPDMSTQFYLNIEDGIDETPPAEEKDYIGNATNDPRITYDVTVQTQLSYQLKATVPMYVCMYGFRGTGNVITPSSDAYQLKNYSSMNASSEAEIVDIVKVIRMARIYDEDHSNEVLHSIAYDKNGSGYTYWYTEPASYPTGWTVHTFTDENINASGECYAFYGDVDGDGTEEWMFKASGVLQGENGDEFHLTVGSISAKQPLTSDFVVGEWNFGKEFKVGDVKEDTDGSVEGLALKVTKLTAEPATWILVPVNTAQAQMRRGELAMSLAPKTAQVDASAIDLYDCSAGIDITANGWFLAAPANVQADGSVAEADATVLPMITSARMAGGNVNDAGCTPVVKVTYTLTPAYDVENLQTNTVLTESVESNRG